MAKFIYVWYLIKTSLCGCLIEQKGNDFNKVTNQYILQKTGKLPAVVNESSGLAITFDKDTYWTINDSGGGDQLFKVTEKGDLVATKTLPNTKNIDWEDLTTDERGNIYIGDVGNNARNRSHLSIYIYNLREETVKEIQFRFPALNSNPSAQEDCEAFFFFNDDIYLFTKSGKVRKGTSRLYKIPAQEGTHVATFIDEIQLDGQITSADINPNAKQMAVLTYGKILFFDLLNGIVNFKQPAGCLKVVRKQTEALMYMNEEELLMTNEQRDIFSIKLKK